MFLPGGVRFGIFGALLLTGFNPMSAAPDWFPPGGSLRSQTWCELRPAPHRKRPCTGDCNRPGRQRCRSQRLSSCNWSRRSRSCCKPGRRLFLGSRLFVDCFFLLSRLFSRLFFRCLLAYGLACSRFFLGCLLGSYFPFLSNYLLFLGSFFSCFLLSGSLLGFCHVNLRKKVAKGTAPKCAATYPRQPGLPTTTPPVLRPACAGRRSGVAAVLNAKPRRPCSPDRGIKRPDPD